MPRTSRCPTCDTNVKVPDAAKRGSLVRCPSCEETFQPPFLKPAKVVEDDDEEEYDPETSESFGLQAHPNGEPPKTRADHAKDEVRRRVNRERRAAAAYERKPRRGWFEGVEGFFLISAIVLAIGIPVLYFGVRRLAEYSNKAAALALVGGLVALVFIHLVFASFFKDRRLSWLDWLFGPRSRD